jgi:hypothetical protein
VLFGVGPDAPEEVMVQRADKRCAWVTHGLGASFMPKPSVYLTGSGCTRMLHWTDNIPHLIQWEREHILDA